MDPHDTVPDLDQPVIIAGPRPRGSSEADRYARLISDVTHAIASVSQQLGEMRAGQLAITGEVGSLSATVREAMRQTADNQLALAQSLTDLMAELSSLVAVERRRLEFEIRSADAASQMAVIGATAAATSTTSSSQAELVKAKGEQERKTYLTRESWETLKPWLVKAAAIGVGALGAWLTL